MKAFTAGEQIRLVGLETLDQVSKTLNKHPQTLANWHAENPTLFNVALIGCAQVSAVQASQTALETTTLENKWYGRFKEPPEWIGPFENENEAKEFINSFYGIGNYK